MYKEVVRQWPPFGINFPKRDSILPIFLRSCLDKMLFLFGKLVPKEGHWQTYLLIQAHIPFTINVIRHDLDSDVDMGTKLCMSRRFDSLLETWYFCIFEVYSMVF